MRMRARGYVDASVGEIAGIGDQELLARRRPEVRADGVEAVVERAGADRGGELSFQRAGVSLVAEERRGT